MWARFILPHFVRRPADDYPFSHHRSRTVSLLRKHDRAEGPQTLFQSQVGSFVVSSGMLYLTPYFMVSESPSTAPVSPHSPLPNTNPNPHHAVREAAKVTLEGGLLSRLRAPYNPAQSQPHRGSKRNGIDEGSQSVDHARSTAVMRVCSLVWIRRGHW